VVPRVRFPVDRLDAGGVVDVGHGRDLRAGDVQLRDAEEGLLLRRHRQAATGRNVGHQQHVWAVAVELEPPGHPLPEHRGRERTERLPVFHLQVQDRLHGGRPGVAEDRAASEGARAELHPALEPAQRLPVRQGAGGGRDEVPVGKHLDRRPGRFEPSLDLLLFECGAEVGPLHPVAAAVRFAGARQSLVEVVCRQGRAQGAAGISGGRLHPEAPEGAVPQDLPVGDAVQRHAPGQAEVPAAGLLREGARHAEDHFLRDRLDGGGQVHLPLRQPLLRLPGGTREQGMEALVGHRQPGAVIEVVEVEAERAVRLYVDDVVVDRLRIGRAAVRRQPHDLVFPRVHLESRVICERGIKEAERMWEMDLLAHLQQVAAPIGRRGRRPFPDAVHREHDGLLERGGEVRARRVGKMMLREDDLRFDRLPAAIKLRELLHQQVLEEQLLPQPDRHRHGEAPEAARRKGEIRLQQALELEERLVVECDRVDAVQGRLPLAQAVRHGVPREPRVVLLAGEPLLLRRGDDVPVRQQCRRAVVVEGRYAEDAHPWRPVRTACR